jgi:PAS domain S-box-containing protein
VGATRCATSDPTGDDSLQRGMGSSANREVWKSKGDGCYWERKRRIREQFKRVPDVMSKQSASIRALRVGVSSWPAALIGIVVIKGVLSLAVKPGSFMVSYSGISYFLLLVIATWFATQNGIQNTLGGRLFWGLLATAYGLWAAHQGLTLYYELVRRIEVPDNSVDDTLLFVHVAVLFAAVATFPHREGANDKPYGTILNGFLVALFCLFVYGYAVFPYQYLFSTAAPFDYALRFDLSYLLENLVLVGTVGVLAVRVNAPWKAVYLHLLGVSILYTLSSTVANLAIDSGGYVNGKLYGLGLTAAVCWFVWIPLYARQVSGPERKATQFQGSRGSQASAWAMLVVVMISIPIVWELFRRNESAGLRTLRVVFAVAMIICLASAAYIKEFLGKRELASHFGLANDRLRMAMEAGNSVGWDWDVKTGRDTWFGDLETMFGIPATSYSGCVEDFRRRIHPQDRSAVWNSVNAAMKNHTPYSAEFRVVRMDGSIRWIAAKGQFYFRPSGEPARMLGIATDITMLKQAQQALHESEERLRMAAQAGRMFAYCWDAATDTIERSGESVKILGIEEKTPLSGHQAIARVHADDREGLRAAIAGLSPEKPLLQVRYRIIRPDGSVIWVERNSRAYFDELGQILRMVGMVADITDRKLAEEALASMSRRLIEAQEAERVRIARDLHDDIGQRLAVCAIALEGLKRTPSDPQGEHPRCITEIQTHLFEVSSSLHTLSHELHPAKLELLGLVAAVRAFCRDLSDRKKADIDFSFEGVPQPLPPEISLCLFRVLQESIQNALKHSGARRIAVQLRGTAEAIDLVVHDGGVGFDQAVAMRSTGLGLTSMRERMKLVNGELSIESQFERGTTIRARVPLSSGVMSRSAV